MEKEKYITQKELDKLDLDQELSLSDRIKNKIILIRNELNIVEKDIEKYPHKQKLKIKRMLRKVIKKFINIRK